MSPSNQNAGGPAVGPPRMDQAFQLQNLHRLAMNPEPTSMGQYADMYTSPSGRRQQEITSHVPVQGAFAGNSRARLQGNSAVQAARGPSEQVSAHHTIYQQGILPQAQAGNANQASSQNIGPTATPGSVLGDIDDKYDSWKMTTSPPRLFMGQTDLGGSTPGASDESSVGTRASSGAFSLISGCDDRLTATDHPVRVPRSVVVDNDPTWSDPNPGGVGLPSYYLDESPTPASRVGISGQRPSLLGRLNFANDYAQDDVQSHKSGDSNATDIQSQIMPLYDDAATPDLYSKPSPAPSMHEETIKPRLRRRIPAPAAHGFARPESFTQAQANPQIPEPRFQQGPPAPRGAEYMGGNNVPYSNTNMVNMALATAGGHTSAIPRFGGIHAPQPISASQASILASPIVMPGLVPAQFRPGTALSAFSNVSNVSNGSVAVNLPARVHSMGGQSPLLTKLLNGFDGVPTAAKMLDADYFPFVETAYESGGPVNYGVIKITNVPFEIGRNEVFAFLGRNSRALHDHLEPIHIVMCRVTGKTLDIFVELQTPADAARAVDRHLDNCAAGRPSKLGDRQVDVHLSDQVSLMKALFPKAHAVQWIGNVPAIPERTISQYQTFRGFVSEEELTMMTKHVDNPARCPFSRGCPERPFECLIGTLKKFPWYKTKHITLRQRYLIFHTTFKFIDILKRKVDRGFNPVRLTASLLKRLIAAAMSCPGFTVLQKADIANLVGLDADRVREFGQPQFAERWRHQYSTSVKMDAPSDLVEWYISVIAKETRENLDDMFSIRERQEVQRLAASTDSYWGYFWLELNLPTAKDLESMTLSQVAEREFAIIEEILRRAARKMPGGGVFHQ